jgi:exodeoxyribonuclease V beta subunit
LAGDPAALRKLVARHCRTQGWPDQEAALAGWLHAWLHSPLPVTAPGPGRAEPGGDAEATPATLGAYQVEMEFWFATDPLAIRALDRTVREHTLGGAERPPLAAGDLGGMLKGYADIVFEHGGRYYVADYKSNRLGETDAAYTAAAMHDEVLRKRYELQSALYLFALHRLLASRVPDYDYERHVGGALCIFLRGHAAPTRGVHVERPPLALMDALDALFAQDAAGGIHA